MCHCLVFHALSAGGQTGQQTTRFHRILWQLNEIVTSLVDINIHLNLINSIYQTSDVKRSTQTPTSLLIRQRCRELS